MRHLRTACCVRSSNLSLSRKTNRCYCRGGFVQSCRECWHQSKRTGDKTLLLVQLILLLLLLRQRILVLRTVLQPRVCRLFVRSLLEVSLLLVVVLAWDFAKVNKAEVHTTVRGFLAHFSGLVVWGYAVRVLFVEALEPLRKLEVVLVPRFR